MRSAYYTGKLPQKRIECISYGRWCGFLMSGDPNGILFRFASEFLREYWKRENCLIDYFLIDYIIQLAYLHFNEFYEQYHSIPYNNPDILELEKLLNDEIDYDTFEEMTLNTSFFKLNWKATHTKKTQRGTSTYYGYLVDKYLTM